MLDISEERKKNGKLGKMLGLETVNLIIMKCID